MGFIEDFAPEPPAVHLASCAGCAWCDALMENGWQACDGCHGWGSDLVATPPGIALCEECLKSEEAR